MNLGGSAVPTKSPRLLGDSVGSAIECPFPDLGATCHRSEVNPLRNKGQKSQGFQNHAGEGAKDCKAASRSHGKTISELALLQLGALPPGPAQSIL